MNIRLMTISLAAVLLAGCGTFQTLGDRAEEAFEAGVNPDQREFHYFREGDEVHYLRRECSGRFCDGHH